MINDILGLQSTPGISTYQFQQGGGSGNVGVSSSYVGVHNSTLSILCHKS